MALVITLQSPHLAKARDLELPGDVPLERLISSLKEALQLPAGDYQLAHGSRVLLRDETLFGVGVHTGGILELLSSQEAPSQRITRTETYATSATLTTVSGRLVALDNFGRDRLRIGRRVPNMTTPPDIDLGEELEGDTVSRNHAYLQRDGDHWAIYALSTTNETRVGDQKIPAGRGRPLKSGDIIQLGGARLAFKQE